MCVVGSDEERLSVGHKYKESVLLLSVMCWERCRKIECCAVLLNRLGKYIILKKMKSTPTLAAGMALPGLPQLYQKG